MTAMRGAARLNVRALVVLISIVVILGGGAVGVRQWRKGWVARQARAASLTAMEHGEWSAAARHLRAYLERFPDDHAALAEYGRAQLAVRPLTPASIGAAVGAYRRLLRLDPLNDHAYEKLALIYGETGNHEGLIYIAEQRLSHRPADLQAHLWKARALWGQKRSAEAQAALEQVVGQPTDDDRARDAYIEACGLLSVIAAAAGTPEGLTDALRWLDRAVEVAPDSDKARLWRARFLRTHAATMGCDAQEVDAAIRADLTHADIHSSTDPRVHLAMCEEWLVLGELERAAAQLAATDAISPDALDGYFLDPADWTAVRFIHAADLALRRGTAAMDVELADAALTKLTERRQRLRILPAAVELYAAAGQVARATEYLEEYRDAVVVTGRAAGSDEGLALLEAVLAKAANQPYRVIEALEPQLGREFQQPRALKLLAEAYGDVGRPRRALAMLERYVQRVADRAALHALARLHLDLGRHAAALRAARQAEALDRGDLAATLLRLEAELHMSASPAPAELDALAAELAALRTAHPDRIDIALLRAATALAQGDHDRADDELRRAGEECLDPIPAVLLRARLAALDSPNAAAEILHDACRRWPARVEPWLALADLEFAAGRLAAALAALEEGRAAITDAAVRQQLALRHAMLELQAGSRAAAAAALRALAEAPDTTLVVRCRALSLLLDLPEIQVDTNLAAALLDRLRTLEGESRGVLWRLQQARLWLAGPNPAEHAEGVRTHLQYCVHADPGWEAPALLLAELEERAGRFAAAEAIYRRLLVENPAASAAVERLVAVLERQGRATDALAALDEFAPVSPGAVGQRVRLALRTGQMDEAVTLLEARLADAPDDARSAVALARVVFQQSGHAAEAWPHLDRAAQMGGDAVLITATRAAILRAAGQPAAARELLDSLVEQSPSYGAYFVRARFLAADGDLPAAEADLRRLTEFEDRAGALAALGLFYAEHGRLTDAVEAWTQALAESPENHGLRGRLVEALLTRDASDDRDRARHLLDELERQHPEDVAVALLRARLLSLEGTPQALAAAERLLQETVDRQPTALLPYVSLAESAAGRGDHAAAKSWALRGLAVHPGRTELLLLQARAEIALGNAALARELARLVLTQRPTDPEAAVLLAAVATQDVSARDEALAALERAAAEAVSPEPLRVAQARVLQAAGRTREAIALLEEFRRTHGEVAGATTLTTLAELYAATSELQAARAAVVDARATDPTNPAVLMTLATLLGRQGDFPELARLTDELLSGANPSAEVLVHMASTLMASAEPQPRAAATRALEHALQQTGVPITLRIDAANLLYRLGAADRSIQAYQNVLAAQPDSTRALNDLAWILAEARQDFAAALAHVDRGLSLEPDNVDLLDTRGVILMNLPDRLAQARADFERCAAALARTSPGSTAHARALWQLGRVCAELGDTAAARGALQEALEIDGRHTVFTADERPQVSRLLERLTPR